MALEAAGSDRRPMVSRVQELETAKEILAEVFHARPGEGERDDTEAAGGERARGSRGGAADGNVLPGGTAMVQST